MNQELTVPRGADLATLDEIDTEDFVTFRTGGQLFGVSIQKVRDILNLDKIAFIPLAPRQVRGSINLRGHIVTVINVRICLGMPDYEPAKKQVVESEGEADGNDAAADAAAADAAADADVVEISHVGVTVEYGPELYTLLVDEIGEVITVATRDKEAVPTTLESLWTKFARNVIQLDGELLVILDSDKLVDPGEHK
ncbi:MAG: chemotaxis protein CheW [Rhodospirillaceae bacterium]|nr:chemotaxis protein CheW [Rhodospirillaceae bacterium]